MTTLSYLGWEGYADGDFASTLLSDSGLRITGKNHISDDAASRLVQRTPEAWDIININTPFVRSVLYPGGFIRRLPEKFEPHVRNFSTPFSRFTQPALGDDGSIIGIPQRCGPFNLVINTNKVSPGLARAQGFRLALDPDFRGRFGILAYEDFNVIHIAIAADLDPFQSFSDREFAAFADAAQRISFAAGVVTADHNALNRALVENQIDFYISGGTYTASPARLAGRSEIRAITPETGPIDGRGGIAFVEINALIKHGGQARPELEAYLTYLASDRGAFAASLAAEACNPVVQMSRASVYERFSRQQLDAMQWDDFEHDMSRCADYSIVPDYIRLVTLLRHTLQLRDLPPQSQLP